MSTYTTYVKRAKKLLEVNKSNQCEIAKMALEVCDINHGGRHKGAYTVSRFASDIGINPKTLHRWISIYREILLKVGIAEPTSEDWTHGERAIRVLKSERKNEGASNSTYSKSVPKDRVKKIFKKVHGNDSDLIRLERTQSYARSALTNIKKLNLGQCDERKLITIMENLDCASDLINTALTSKKKGA